MDKQITEDVVEAVARAICVSCEENPDHRGDARGNEFRWQDYRGTALAAIDALTAAQQQADCRCIDCGGNRPDHDLTCSYMHELYGEQPEPKYEEQSQ